MLNKTGGKISRELEVLNETCKISIFAVNITKKCNSRNHATWRGKLLFVSSNYNTKNISHLPGGEPGLPG